MLYGSFKNTPHTSIFPVPEQLDENEWHTRMAEVALYYEAYGHICKCSYSVNFTRRVKDLAWLPTVASQG